MLRRTVLKSTILVALLAWARPRLGWPQATQSRVYLMPTIGTGTHTDSLRPAYLADLTAGALYHSMRYGPEPVCLFLSDVTATQHTALAAHADVIAVPANLSNQVGGAVSAIQTALEALNIPAQWVQSSLTYAQVVRQVATIFQFMQRLTNFTGSLFAGGATLGTAFQDLPLATRQGLQQAAQALNYDTSGLSGATTLRQILKGLGGQFPAGRPVALGGGQEV